MKKQEVKSILDRLFDLSVLAEEKGHSLRFSYRNKSHIFAIFYLNKEELTNHNDALVNTSRFLCFDGELDLLENDIKLIESHLNS